MRILYEDDCLLVCYKEAGLPVQQRSLTQPDLVSMLKNHIKEGGISSSVGGKAAGKGRGKGESEPYLGIVHRLDQPVEGLLVFAKTKEDAAALSAQLQQGSMHKQYRAKVRIAGEPLRSDQLPLSGTLRDFLVKDARTNTSRIARPDEPNAKESILQYVITELLPEDLPQGDGPASANTLPSGPGRQTAVVKINLLTGRHHQIRVQFAHALMPLAGDRKYGLPGERGPLALCACTLTFVHPRTQEEMTFDLNHSLPPAAVK
ncbi:MAG: RluA family pseudouridine synthase [Lachnospiraceae bacterium]|nr:RluA family pseudouridine synthase [Lachnospiraceae bacterium]